MPNGNKVGSSISMALRWLIASLLALIVASTGCSSDDEINDNGPPDAPPLVGAQGVSIREVAVYQSLKRVLMVDGQVPESTVPLVQNRPGLLRIFYSADPSKVDSAVTARLQFEGQAPFDVPGFIATTDSTDADFNSTINIAIDAAAFGPELRYTVAILDNSSEDNPTARWPQAGVHAVAVTGAANTLRVVMAPFRYDADGSGRLPNLSEEQVEVYRRRFMELYPVSNVEMTVRAPEPWSQAILPNGQGWQEVGLRLFGFRNQDGQNADVYYYGIFNPTETRFEFCKSGCLLGVTLLNDMPSDVGNPSLRLALGTGFEDSGPNTAAHEIGHAHGRRHAPCGPGLDPSSIDGSYPHAGGKVGIWGWNMFSNELIDPNIGTDIMGYCRELQWISDHNYNALLSRGAAVNLPSQGAPTMSFEAIAIDANGRGKWSRSSQTLPTNIGRALQVEGISPTGRRQLSARFLRYDHLPGGWLLVPRKARLREVVVSFQGQRLRLQR